MCRRMLCLSVILLFVSCFVGVPLVGTQGYYRSIFSGYVIVFLFQSIEYSKELLYSIRAR